MYVHRLRGVGSAVQTVDPTSTVLKQDQRTNVEHNSNTLTNNNMVKDDCRNNGKYMFLLIIKSQ